jgi:hypothetical protein
MNVRMAQGRIKAESVDEVRAAASKMFEALNAARPEGIRYAWFIAPERDTFVALAQLDDGVENPVPGLPEFQAIQDRMEDWLVEPPAADELTLVGAYRLF